MHRSRVKTQPESEPQTVVVLGMHRSGTSMIAGVLHRLGVCMGENLLGRMVSNPLGHFEDIRFVELDDRLLAAAGGDWRRVPAAAAILAQADAFEGEIKGLLRTDGHRAWGWKDPRACLTVELFLPHLRNPFFIVCHRECREVAASLLKRDGMPLKEGLALKEIYDRRLEEFFAIHPDMPRLELEYREALEAPEDAVRRIVAFLALKTSICRIGKARAMIKSSVEIKKRAESLRNSRPVYERVKDLERRIRWKIRGRSS